MPIALRSLAVFFGLVWVVVLPVWMVGERIPSTLGAERVRPGDWQGAMAATLDLPERWQAGHGRPPLLPVDGKIERRGENVVLTGMALVPGTFAAENIALRVVWASEVPATVLYPRAPLLPFLGPPAELATAAHTIELCCGISQPQQPQRQGLHVRYGAGQLLVFGTDAQTPLFPPVPVKEVKDKEHTRTLVLTVNGNRVRVSCNGEPAAEFHTTVPLKGAVGVRPADGVMMLQRIEVTRPR
jgi:hypothetical protein